MEEKKCSKHKKCCKGSCDKNNCENETDLVLENEKLLEDVGELKNQVLRAYAEVENIKKRADIDIKNRTNNAISSFAKSVIPVADNLDMALMSFEKTLDEKSDDFKQGIKPLLDGIKMVENMLINALQANGIERIQTVGQAFDATKHLAVSQMKKEGFKSGTIVEEIQKGYILDGKIIKEAMVIVAE